MTDTSPTPADLLRAAAEKLRAASTAAAEHSGNTTWQSIRHFPGRPGSDFTTLTAGPGRPLHKGGGGGRGAAPYMHAPVSEYAALMGPGVGLDLAALLEAVAVDAIRCRCVPECPTGAALAVARQLLGTSTAEGARCICGETACESEYCDCDTRTCPVDHAAEETDEEREDREATARDHAAGDHQHCGITCEVELPTEHLRTFVIAKGYPGTAGALDELLRRAAAPPAPADRPDLPDRLKAVLTERFTARGNPFSEMRRQEKGPDGWPASHPVGPHGVAEVLRELLADEQPAPEEPA